MAIPAPSYYSATQPPVAGGRLVKHAYWRSLPTGWSEVTTTGVTPSHGIMAYSGMALDTLRGKLYFHGGGHNDYFGNDTWELDLESRVWLQHYESDMRPEIPLAEAQTLVDNVNYPGAVVINGAPVRPISRHTYASVHYVPSLDVMTVAGGSTYSGTGEYLWLEIGGAWYNDPRDLWTYSPASRTFDYKGSARTNLTDFWATKSAAHPTDGKLYVLLGDSNGYLKCRTIDVATGQTVIRPAVHNDQVASLVALAFEPTGRYLYALTQQFYTSGQIRLIRYDTLLDQFYVMPVNGGSAPNFLYDESFHIVYSPLTRKVYALANNSYPMFVYDVDTGVWSSVALPATMSYYLQTSGRLVFDSARKCMLLVYAGQYTGLRFFAYKE